jgi:feruloyl esterase
MSPHSGSGLRYRRSTSLTAILAGCVAAVSIAAAPVSADQARGANSGLTIVPDLEASCHPEAIQATVAKLSQSVRVMEISDAEVKFPGGMHYVAATEAIPAYCQITGNFVTNDKTGKTANFLATLPAAWNGKYLQMGCGGHCGEFVANNAASLHPYITSTQQGYPGEIILKGYASFSTDEGHQGKEPGAWAVKGSGQVDEQAIEDLYYRADQVLARLGKAFTVAFYAQATQAPQKLSRSYFSGCSGGGRDAFVAASYFPEEFDGIVGGSAYTLMGHAFQTAGMSFAAIRSPDAGVPAALIRRIDPIVKAKCDRLDGVEDGLIQNPAACDFRPELDLPRCDGKTARTHCFTQAQIDTISTVVNAVTDEAGNVVQPGYSISDFNPSFPPPPAVVTTEDPWPEGNGQNSLLGMWGLAHAALATFVHKNDPQFTVRSIVGFQSGGPGAITGFHTVIPRSEVSRAFSAARMGIGHTPENAASLIKLNRKFLIWVNLSDQVLAPYASINYYKKLAQLHGGYATVQKNIRLFAIPDSGHCSAYGDGPGNFDALTAMEDWVEKGQAPDALLARLYDPDSALIDPRKTPLRTMPLCKFPEMAHYSGKGDINEAANWSCPAGDSSMLTVGASGQQAGVIQ